VWAGLGTAGIAVVGVIFLGEGWDVLKGVALLMIISGVVILNLHGAH
jgi:small multidrug resistance pump